MNYNESIVPTGTFKYPPIILDSASASSSKESTLTHCSKTLQSILKKSEDDEGVKKSSLNKKVNWSPSKTVRTITKDSKIKDSKLDKSYNTLQFLVQHGVVTDEDNYYDRSSTGVVSADPQDIKEIKRIRGKHSIQDMDDAEIKKNYNRLLKKLEHVFKSRSPGFQRDVRWYIDNRYLPEIRRRGLSI